MTNVSTHASEVLSAATTPDVPVADAVRMSMSIPLFFESLQFKGTRFGSGDYYADGGVLDNYPIHVFDDPKYEKANPWFLDGTNWETLGCHLYTPKDCPRDRKPITNIITYIENLIESLLNAQEVAFENNEVDQQRTINVSNCCVQTTDFQIKPHDQKYNELVDAGKAATQAYLEGYKQPSPS